MPEPTTAIIDSIVKTIGVIVSPRIAVTAFVVACTLFFAPHVVPGTWIDSVASAYRPWVGLAALFSGVLSGTYAVAHAWTALKVIKLRAKHKRALHIRLQELTLAEKHLLQEHFEDNKRTVAWSMNRLEVSALLVDKVIGVINLPHGNIGYLTVTNEAWKYLRANPDLIATPQSPKPPRSGNEWMI